MSENVKRYTPDIKTGLTDSQIKERIERAGKKEKIAGLNRSRASRAKPPEAGIHK